MFAALVGGSGGGGNTVDIEALLDGLVLETSSGLSRGVAESDKPTSPQVILRSWWGCIVYTGGKRCAV